MTRYGQLIGTATVALGAVLVAAASWQLSKRSAHTEAPLAGELDHDFGEVAFEDVGISLSHTFVLTNVADSEVVIESLIPTCGCTAAVATRRDIPPGNATEIEVTLRLETRGRRHETVWVGTKDHGVVPLRVTGAARSVRQQYVVPTTVDLG